MNTCLQDLPTVNLMHIDLTHIMSEVRIHGFCVMHCSDIVKQVSSLDEMKMMVYKLANSVGLKVSFNDEKILCVFEQCQNPT